MNSWHMALTDEVNFEQMHSRHSGLWYYSKAWPVLSNEAPVPL